MKAQHAATTLALLLLMLSPLTHQPASGQMGVPLSPDAPMTMDQLQTMLQAQQKQIADLQAQVEQLKKQAADLPKADKTAVPADRRAAVKALLDQPVKEMSFADKGLENILTFLQEGYALNLNVNWTALGVAGVEKTTPVPGLNMKNTTIGEVLTRVLTQLNATTPLEYEIQDGSVCISTRTDLAANEVEVVKLYDVRKLLPEGPGAEAAQAKLVVFVEAAVLPGSWSDADGPGACSITMLNGMMAVKQTQDGHDQVAEVLRKLLESQK